jgi:hypothetical protein
MPALPEKLDFDFTLALNNSTGKSFLQGSDRSLKGSDLCRLLLEGFS